MSAWSESTSSDEAGESWVPAPYCQRALSEHMPGTAMDFTDESHPTEPRHRHLVTWDSYRDAAQSFQRLVNFAGRCTGFSSAELERRATPWGVQAAGE